MWNICANTSAGASNNTFTQAASRVFNVNMVTADDDSTAVVGSVSATGMYLSNYSLNFAVEGPATESVTLVGNSCSWTSGLLRLPSKGTYESGILPSTASPDASASGIIQRKHVTSFSRVHEGSRISILGSLQSVSFSISFDREDLLALGSKHPYFKAANFPVETSLELEYIAGKLSQGPEFIQSNCDVGERINSAILKAGNRTFNFGTMNWTGTSKSGGDAGGGNATTTSSYVGYNAYDTDINAEWTAVVNACTSAGYDS